MSSLISTGLAARLVQALCFVWAGLVLGISFLEAPVKFRAPTLTREAGLDVGRHVFTVLNRAELALAVGGGLLLVAARPRMVVRVIGSGIGVLLLLKTAWLLPELRDQARIIIDGGDGPVPNYVHLGYIFTDALKVGALVVVGGWVTLA